MNEEESVAVVESSGSSSIISSTSSITEGSKTRLPPLCICSTWTSKTYTICPWCGSNSYPKALEIAYTFSLTLATTTLANPLFFFLPSSTWCGKILSLALKLTNKAKGINQTHNPKNEHTSVNEGILGGTYPGFILTSNGGM